MKVTRSLLAFAYVAENFQATGDLGQGLLPLFAPIISARTGTKFIPEVFAEDVRKNYDIDMHPYVAEELAPRLAKAGFLKEIAKYELNIVYQNISIDLPEPPVSEGAVQDLVDRFTTYARERLAKTGQIFEQDVLEEGFLDRLVQADFLGLILKPDKTFPNSKTLSIKLPEEEKPDETDDIRLHLDFLVANFILELANKSPNEFSLLVSISSGALVSEVILNLQHPPDSGDTLNGLKVVLDGPLIMDYLGLGQSDHIEYAKLLIRQLKNLDAELVTLGHIVEEIDGAIRTPLMNFERGYDVYGPIGKKLLSNRPFAAYLRSILGRLPEEIKDSGIEILPFSNVDRATARTIFTEKLEGDLSESIGLYKHAESKLRDARSVADVVRLRGRDEVKSIVDAKVVFVTRNSRLANLSRKFLVRTSLASEGYFPPCITDRQLAGLLWIMCGGGGDQLSRLRLIANCTAAITPRKDVVSRMYRFLDDLDEKMAKRFEALMTNERAEHFLMDRTLGDVRLVTEENFEEIYREVELIAAERVTEEKNAEIDEIRKQYARDIEKLSDDKKAAVDKAIDKALQAKEKLKDERKRKKEAESKSAHLEGEVGALLESKKQKEMALVNACRIEGVKAVKKAMAKAAFVIFVTAISLGLGSELLPDILSEGGLGNATLVAFAFIVISAAVSVLNHYSFPGKALDRYIQKQRDRAVQDHSKSLGIEDLLSCYAINWKTNQIEEKL